MTDRLYYDDSYQKEFNAVIMEKSTIQNHPAICLDKTLFYPTSGGQMHDTGILENVSVLDVVIENDKIWHILDKEINKTDVHGQINWTRRFDFMQQHTGFHILAGSFLQCFQIETLSSHLGEDYSTIDVQCDQLSIEHIKRVEDLANHIIWENRPVRTFWANADDLDNSLLRKKPEDFEKIRLVEIDGFDLDPCGGTHVSSTAQVGVVKILGSEKIRGYMRYTFVSGARALREMQKQFTLLNQLGTFLTTGADGLVPAVEKLVDENKKNLKTLQELEKQLEEEIVNELTNESSRLVVKCLHNMKPDALRRVASMAVKKSESIFLLGSTGNTPCLVFAASDSQTDLRPVFQQVVSCINGRGGGSPAFVQGGGTNSDGIQSALDKAFDLLQSH